MMKSIEFAVKLENVGKVYPNGTVANQGINLKVKYGEIHALFGENGAGKSTLIKILMGELQPTTGKIKINDQLIPFNTSAITKSLQMAVVHQHFSLIENFSIFENVILGYEIKDKVKLEKIQKKYKTLFEQLEQHYQKQMQDSKANKMVVDKMYKKQKLALKLKQQNESTAFFCYQKGIKQNLANIVQQFNLNLDLKAIIDDLSVSKKQKTEILKVLFREAKIIIFDEPTSVISQTEIDKFLKSLLSYKKSGKAIIFISHKINEIRRVADQVTVLRKGEVVGNFAMKQVSDDKLITLMVGKKKLFPIAEIVRKPVSAERILAMQDVKLHINGKDLLDQINLTIHKGEIVGLAGIEENGQKELLETISGINRSWSGSIFYLPNSEKPIAVNKTSPTNLKKLGMAYIPKDRQYEGLLLHDNLYFNTFFNNWNNAKFFSYGFINRNNILQQTKKIIAEYQIYGAHSPYQSASSLSGGNQQKFIIGRELETDPHLLLINEPTWGIDVGTINHLNKLFLQIRNKGKSILFASSELSLMCAISDRICVMSKGKIVGEVNPKLANASKLIGKLMSHHNVVKGKVKE